MNDKHYNNHNLKKIQTAIKEGPQPLYELYNNESVGRLLSSVQLEYVPHLDRISKKSLKFKLEDNSQDLAIIFGLNPAVFGEKYLQTISGNGQEGQKIITLRSLNICRGADTAAYPITYIGKYMPSSSMVITLTGWGSNLKTILYQFPDSIDIEGRKFEDYNRIYGILTDGLNDLLGSNITVLKHCLTYQDVFRTYALDDSVRTFYSL